MKTSLVVPVVLIMILACPRSGVGYGSMGLYADQDATITQVEASGGQLPLYLVAMDPVDDSGSVPGSLQGFECLVTFQSASDFVMDVSFPVSVINVGTLDNLIVGFGSPLPLPGSAVVLATVVVYTNGQPESNIFLGPSEPASIPGYLAVIDQDFNLMPMEPVSGDIQRPVFYINSGGPPLENASWGTAKILYR